MDRTQIIEFLKEELSINLSIEGSRVSISLSLGEEEISWATEWLDIRRIQNEHD